MLISWRRIGEYTDRAKYKIDQHTIRKIGAGHNKITAIIILITTYDKLAEKGFKNEYVLQKILIHFFKKSYMLKIKYVEYGNC